MASGFVTVYQTGDPLLAEMLTDVLVQEGLDARLLGTRHGAAIGVAQNILRMRIEVPWEQVARATEVIEAWEQGADAEPEPSPEPAPLTPASRPDRRSPILAAGVAFLVPGGSHFYARRPWTAALLLAGIVLGFVGVAQPDRVQASAAFLFLVGLVLFDVAWGQIAVRALNAGRRLSPLRQVLVGAGALVTMGCVGALVAPHLPHARKPAPVPLFLEQPEPLRLDAPRGPLPPGR